MTRYQAELGNAYSLSSAWQMADTIKQSLVASDILLLPTKVLKYRDIYQR